MYYVLGPRLVKGLNVRGATEYSLGYILHSILRVSASRALNAQVL